MVGSITVNRLIFRLRSSDFLFWITVGQATAQRQRNQRLKQISWEEWQTSSKLGARFSCNMLNQTPQLLLKGLIDGYLCYWLIILSQRDFYRKWPTDPGYKTNRIFCGFKQKTKTSLINRFQRFENKTLNAMAPSFPCNLKSAFQLRWEPIPKNTNPSICTIILEKCWPLKVNHTSPRTTTMLQL